jgi:excisionase family DNA binding protein
VARLELEFFRASTRSGAPRGHSIEGKGLNAPKLDQEPLVASIASVVSQPIERFPDQSKEHAGSVINVSWGNAGTRGSLARPKGSSTRETILDLRNADLQRTFLGRGQSRQNVRHSEVMSTHAPPSSSRERTLEPLLSIDATAAFLGISRRQVYTLLERRELPHVRVGKRTRFIPADLRVYLERHRQSRSP